MRMGEKRLRGGRGKEEMLLSVVELSNLLKLPIVFAWFAVSSTTPKEHARAKKQQEGLLLVHLH